MTQFKRSIAIIIGINQYQNGIPALKTAVNDAIAIGQVLKADHDYQVVLLRDQQVSLVTLRSLLTDKLPALVQPDDRVLFYFAGHGLAFNGDDGPEGYLIPQDAKLGDSTTYLPMTLVHDSLTALPCRHFLGIFDCCFAGAFRWSATRRLSPIPQVIHKERFARFLTDPAWQVITSAADDQEAMDALSIKDHRGVVGRHSPFAEALIKALQADSQADASPPPRDGKPAGDGVITATELYQYLRDAVEPDTTAHAMRQTPGLWPLKNHGKGEFVFMVPGRQPDLPNAPQLNEAANPYRGLEAFEEQHQHLFFGRKQLIQDLQAFAENHPLTIVLGASGTGKSSLVKAGLVPALKQDLAPDGQPLWQVLPIMRPGVAPLKAILQTLPGPDLVATLADLDPKTWADHLSQSLEQWRQANPQRRLLLVVDQAEELFSLCRDGVQRQQFLEILDQLLDRQAEQFHVILTLRSDFEPQFRNSPLVEHWACDRFTIRPMNREELRAAIEAPASAKVMYFEPPSLVDRLIDEVSEMPGALPLLSFTLRELFLKYLRSAATRTNRAITEADYEELGGIKQALVNRAEEEYHDLVDVDAAFATTIRHVMLRMVATSGTGNTRRQVLLSELDYPEPEGARVQQVLTRFKEARLLVGDTTADEQPYVEPAHDALVEGWPRLLQWLEVDTQAKAPAEKIRKGRLRWLPTLGNSSLDSSLDEREKLLLQRRLTPAANDWRQERTANFLWNADPRLPLLRQIRQKEPYWFNKLESEFIQKSIRRKNFNTRRNWAVAIAVMLGLSTGLVFSLISQRNALIEQINATRQSAEANFRANQQLEALIDSLRAAKTLQDWPYYLAFFSPNNQLRNEVSTTLRNMAYGVQEVNRGELSNGWSINNFWADENGSPWIIVEDSGIRIEDRHGNLTAKIIQSGILPGMDATSRDGKKIAAVLQNGNIKVWDSQGNELAELWEESSAKVNYNNYDADLKFSPDAKTVVTVGDPTKGGESVPGKTLKVWNVEENKLNQALVSNPFMWGGIGFTPDGDLRIAKLIALDPDDININNSYAVEVTDLSGQILAMSNGIGTAAVEVHFSPNGERLAIKYGEESSNAMVLDIETNLSTHLGNSATGGRVGSVEFKADGDYVYSGVDGRVYDSQGIEIFQLPLGNIQNLLLTPDGQRLITIADDEVARLWDLTNQPLTTSEITESDVESLSFSLNGRTIITKSLNNTIFEIDGQGNVPGELAEIPGITSAFISPDGQMVAAIREAGKVSLLNLQDQQVDEFQAHSKKVESLVWSSNSRELATIGDSGMSARLWNLSGELLGDKEFNPMGAFRLESIGFDDSNRPLLIVRGTENQSFDNISLASFSSSRQPNIIPGRQAGNSFGVVRLSPDGSFLVTSSGQKIAYWNLRGEKIMEFLSEQDDIKTFSISPDGSKLAVIANDGSTVLWQLGELDDLIDYACNRISNYLKSGPDVAEENKNLCNVAEIPDSNGNPGSRIL